MIYNELKYNVIEKPWLQNNDECMLRQLSRYYSETE